MAMFLIIYRKHIIRWGVGFIAILIGTFCTQRWWPPSTSASLPADSEIVSMVDDLFRLRNHAILQAKPEVLETLYDRSTRYGQWSYEHQYKKLKYLHNWTKKQGAKLTAIRSLVRIRRIDANERRIRVTLLASTEYRYVYIDEPQVENLMRIGTYHSLDLVRANERWQIGREWFTDPFADALSLNNPLVPEERKFILTQKPRDFSNLSPRRRKALEYADTYCGAAANDEQGFKYNPKYRNYNYTGGDCANFASQVLHEGGGFRKTYTWNYGRGASKAWVNAHAFNRYMLQSGRGTRIAYDTYSQVLPASYRLEPGDYIAYEKKGKVTHISVVTGADSKGYTVMNSHNADRYRVPWDLGYSDQGIRFWLVKVNYGD